MQQNERNIVYESLFVFIKIPYINGRKFKKDKKLKLNM